MRHIWVCYCNVINFHTSTTSVIQYEIPSGYDVENGTVQKEGFVTYQMSKTAASAVRMK